MTVRIEGMNQEIKVMTDMKGKYLTFTLADEEYGISAMKIREIIGIMPITTVPQTPEFVKGVINLRRKVIPVLDLRLKFGLRLGENESDRLHRSNEHHCGGA